MKKRLSFIFLVVIILAVLLLFFWPVKTIPFFPSKPCLTYEESLKRIQDLEKRREMPVAEYCRPVILTHGHKTENAVVLYHGYTNCPRQYEVLAELLFERGYNVYVPRLIYHGSPDRTTKNIGKLTVEDIVRFCVDSIDITYGLGEKITVMGLSMGGVMAAWNAQFSENIDTAVVIVPSFGWYFMPGMVKPLINLSRVVPNFFIWWDPLTREKRSSPYSMYHHFSSKGSGHILALGRDVVKHAKYISPQARRIIVLENEIDVAVDSVIIRRLINNWRRHEAGIVHYVFPETLRMEHDIIDPLHPYEQSEIVYQKILNLLEGEE